MLQSILDKVRKEHTVDVDTNEIYIEHPIDGL